MVPCRLGGKVKSSKKISAIFGFSIVENLVYTPISKSESTLPYKRSNRAAVMGQKNFWIRVFQLFLPPEMTFLDKNFFEKLTPKNFKILLFWDTL